ncbi:peptidoglycan-binding protein [Streptomyces sp. BH104]|uniref:peptidoglycan-binding protein n=1 Tax=Streptomyces sp. BH104 TaxID=3410407 RepID=UPI003BB4F938
MKLVERTAWGAPATSPAAYQASTRGVKVHYLGSAYSSRAHSLCDDYVRKIRAEHLANTQEDYVDIAYNAVVCEHGYVFEGRGLHKRTGANGNQTLNQKDYAVCALLGSSGVTEPTDAMLGGLRDAIEWFRAHGSAGDWVGGHRDGYATACPGDPLYAWVKAGAPRPAGGGGGSGSGGTYKVKVGDTLSGIARRLNLDWKEIAKVNGLTAPYTIYIGQELHLPEADNGTQAPPYPGRSAFVLGRRNAAVTQFDKQLVRLGFTRHNDGDGYQPGPLFTEYTRRNIADFQRSRPELSGDPDGYPGPVTWELGHTLPA